MLIGPMMVCCGLCGMLLWIAISALFTLFYCLLLYAHKQDSVVLMHFNFHIRSRSLFLFSIFHMPFWYIEIWIGTIWTLVTILILYEPGYPCIYRSLQELSSVLLLPNSMMEISSMPSSTLNEVFLSFWHVFSLMYVTLMHPNSNTQHIVRSDDGGSPCENDAGQLVLIWCAFPPHLLLCFPLFFG